MDKNDSTNEKSVAVNNTETNVIMEKYFSPHDIFNVQGIISQGSLSTRATFSIPEGELYISTDENDVFVKCVGSDITFIFEKDYFKANIEPDILKKSEIVGSLHISSEFKLFVEGTQHNVAIYKIEKAGFGAYAIYVNDMDD